MKLKDIDQTLHLTTRTLSVVLACLDFVSANDNKHWFRHELKRIMQSTILLALRQRLAFIDIGGLKMMLYSSTFIIEQINWSLEKKRKRTTRQRGRKREEICLLFSYSPPKSFNQCSKTFPNENEMIQVNAWIRGIGLLACVRLCRGNYDKP